MIQPEQLELERWGDVQKKRYQRYEVGNVAGKPGFTGLSVLQGKVIRSDMKSNISANPPDSLRFKEWKYSFL